MSEIQLCCRAGGSNLNAGSRTGNSTVPGTSASFTYAGGSWDDGTGIFTVASGDPASDGVAVDDIASVYTSGDTETPFIGLVTERDSTTITVSLTNCCGVPPAAGTRTLKIGGAWAGPSGSTAFPFTILSYILNPNNPDEGVRVNLKTDLNPITPGATGLTINVGVSIEGFTTAYEDGGIACLDDGNTGNTIVTFSGIFPTVAPELNSIELKNGSIGISGYVSTGYKVRNFSIHDMSSVGVNLGGSVSMESGDLYNNASSGCVAGIGGYGGTPSGTVTISNTTIRDSAVAASAYGYNLIIRDSVVSGCTYGVGIVRYATNPPAELVVISSRISGCTSGAAVSSTGIATIIDTVINNNSYGGVALGPLGGLIERCSITGNGSNGVGVSGAGLATIRDSVITENGGYGVSSGTSPVKSINNAFWSNTSGVYDGDNIQEFDNINLTGDPFINAAGGNYGLNSTSGAGLACKATGDGEVLGVRKSWMDRGAVQTEATSGGTTGARTFTGM